LSIYECPGRSGPIESSRDAILFSVPDFYRLIAPHYDSDYVDHDRDVAFYVQLAAECGGSVLEMGCGTGRVLLPTARAGISIHGLDSSPEMLGVLRDKLAAEPADVRERVSQSQGDMRTSSLDRTFALVTAPFRGVQHLYSRDDQRAWLRNVRRHLRPGGCLCFDVFQPDYDYVAGPTGPAVQCEIVDPATGWLTRRIANTSPSAEIQRVEIHYRWVTENAAGATVAEDEARTAMRWFTRAELESLLELEGFEIREYWGDFDRQPFGEGSTEQIILATPDRSRKPGTVRSETS